MAGYYQRINVIPGVAYSVDLAIYSDGIYPNTLQVLLGDYTVYDQTNIDGAEGGWIEHHAEIIVYKDEVDFVVWGSAGPGGKLMVDDIVFALTATPSE